MKKTIISAVMAATVVFPSLSEQYSVSRIDKMPAIPQPYVMRDWKAVTKGYVELVLNPHDGEYFPLCTQSVPGNNYAGYNPLYIDTYVGWNSHGQGSECINALPAVVSAYLTGNQDCSSYDLTGGIIDFFNAKNGQNVYLNTFSAESGKDWWYDLMPNVYYYQLYQLAEMPDAELAREQYLSVADQWLKAVFALGGQTYNWTMPSMSHRAFDLAAMKPVDSGVTEPESAGSMAWLLFHAYLETGEKKYLRGAELSMEYLSSLGSNPSYELQLAYGVQAAAKMNAMLGTTYNVTKLFGNCFDRGYLRGWGSIIGTWGGYDVSGLIGEANDKGNDYAFVMNGFQQAAALAPAVKYDKRLARAYGRWMVNMANASRLFYAGYLPTENMEGASYAWSVENDPGHVIPYESMKEVWGGKTPYAMGDAVGGGWAKTNLSLYSGSSVGYLAAVLSTTEVEAILQLDLNKTDFDGLEKYDTYLYYNPYTSAKQVKLELPGGDAYKIYDAITETYLTRSATGSYNLSIPADDVRLVTLVPANATERSDGNKLYAGDIVVDYHYGYDFEKLLRVKNLEAADPYPVVGGILEAKATVDGALSDARYSWSVDGKAVDGSGLTLSYSLSGVAAGEHQLEFTVSGGGKSATETISFTVLSTAVDAPEIGALSIGGGMPAEPSATVGVTCTVNSGAGNVDVKWSVSGGRVVGDSGSKAISWELPEEEGVYAVTCEVSNVKGTATATGYALVRSDSGADLTAMACFPFENSLSDVVGSWELAAGSGSGSAKYGAGHGNGSAAALLLEGNWFHLPLADALSPTDAVSVSLWVNPQQWNGLEQFLVSHGSWQDRYKLSITPEKKVRWTVKTSQRVVDVDCPTELSLGTYGHFCAVYTGFSAELYHNGKLCAFAPLSGTLGTTSQPITVGAMTASDPSYNYYGLVDDLNLFGGALSPRQIRALSDYDAGTEAVAADLSDGVKFNVVGGMLNCNRQDVKILGVYSFDGRLVGRGSSVMLSSGLYIVEYEVADRGRAAAKISVTL